jgi:hypothetical protein
VDRAGALPQTRRDSVKTVDIAGIGHDVSRAP